MIYHSRKSHFSNDKKVGYAVLMLTKFSNKDQLLEDVFHGSRSAMLITDTSGVVQAMNSVMSSMTKFSAEDVINKFHWSVFIPPADIQQSEVFFNRLVANGEETSSIQADLLSKDAQKVPMNWSFSVLRDQESRIEYVVMMGNEISEDLFQGHYSFFCDQLLEVMNPVMITNVNGQIIKVNQAFVDVTGYKAIEVLGKNPSMLSSGQHGEAFYRQLWQSLKENGEWQGELTNRHKKGHTYTELTCIRTIYDANQQTRYYVASFNDISEFKKMKVS